LIFALPHGCGNAVVLVGSHALRGKSGGLALGRRGLKKRLQLVRQHRALLVAQVTPQQVQRYRVPQWVCAVIRAQLWGDPQLGACAVPVAAVKDIEARLRFDDDSRVINVSTRRGGDVPRSVAEDITPKDDGNSLSASLKREPFSITVSASGRGPINQALAGRSRVARVNRPLRRLADRIG
jgi:hypothetical protein